MDIDFYLIDSNYVDFLKKAELDTRGFTCVPNIHYSSRDKFFYGTVMQKNGMNYFVPVSHNAIPDKNAIIITGKKRNSKSKPHVYGSLRFSYMLPVPNQMLKKLKISELESEDRKRAVNDELAFCRRNRDKIKQQAHKTYDSILSSCNSKVAKNCCDFKLLEQACIEFCKIHDLELSVSAIKQSNQPIVQAPNETTSVSKEKYDALLQSNLHMKEVIDTTNLVLNEHPKLKSDFREAKAETLQKRSQKEAGELTETKTEGQKLNPHKPKR